jgi:hypothetical protein
MSRSLELSSEKNNVTRSLGSVVRVLVLSCAIFRNLDGSAQPSYDTLAGRLATVEPAAARITVIADGEVQMRALNVAPDAQIRKGQEELTLSELVIQVGRRVVVTYVSEDGAVIASEITVEPEQSAQPHPASTRSIPPR